MAKTRFAPTSSGELHLGSLSNCLLSYIVAKKEGSEFLIRMDRHPDQRKYEAQIIKDVRAFGMIPDDIIFTRNREERYLEVLDRILKTHQSSGQVYFCNCDVNDINYRAASNMGKDMAVLHREEKYPGPCKIKQIRVFSMNDPGNDHAPKASATATISSREHPPKNVVDDSDNYWCPKDVGYLGTRDPELSLTWENPIWISKVEITYVGVPLRAMALSVGTGSVHIHKSSPFFYSPRLPEESVDCITMAPMFTKHFKLIPESCMYEVKKPYFYDGHCRTAGTKTLPISDRSTTIRTRYSREGFLPDAALWFDGQADLMLTSIIDDMDYGIEVRVRGEDIRPFTWLEDQAAGLLLSEEEQSRGAGIPNLFHAMLVDDQMVKFSKFIKSPPAVSYLKNNTPLEVLLYLAGKLGLLPFSKDIGSLEELVAAVDLAYLEDSRVAVVCKPEEELTGGLPKCN